MAQVFTTCENLSISGAGGFSSKAFILTPLLQRKTIWLTTTKSEQENVHRNLEFWKGGSVESFKLLKQGDIRFSSDVQRLNAIHIMERISKLMSKNGYVLVMRYEDLFIKVPTKKGVKEHIVKVSKGDSVEPVEFFQKLIAIKFILPSTVIELMILILMFL